MNSLIVSPLGILFAQILCIRCIPLEKEGKFFKSKIYAKFFQSTIVQFILFPVNNLEVNDDIISIEATSN